ncbi:MAG: NAD(P)-dependent oxidoreductase [Candidatus Saccharimonadales bacterium]
MDDSNIVIIGSKGQLGKALQAKYPNARGVDADELDITDLAQMNAFDWSGVSVILNAAAYTNVDGAETPEGRVAAWAVNGAAPGNLANIALSNDITLVHISTEYVFDGTKTPHVEDEPFSPLGVYGQAKAAGDIAVSLAPKHYILRTSWVIGDGNNFVRTMLGLGKKGISPTVVGDQIGRLTFTSELVRAIDHLLTAQAAYGTYNLSNGGESASWADITREIFKLGGFTELTVTDTSTEEYFASKPEAAPRPLQSTMDLSKIEATGFTLTDWQTELKAYIENESQGEQA